jgi:hypothetical protein
MSKEFKNYRKLNIKIVQNLQNEMTLMKTKLETLQNHPPNVSESAPKKPVNEFVQTSGDKLALPPKIDEPKANWKEWRTLEEVEQMRIIREDFQRANELEMDWNDSLEVDGNPNTLYSKKG